MSSSNLKQVDRAFGLDLCRTIAILLVVSGHTLQHSKPLPFLAEMGILGMFGVDLFFCLSGFLIGRILLAESSDWSINYEKGIFRFWYRRWMRTLPLYFFWLFISLKYDCCQGETTLNEQLPYVLFTQNLAWQMPIFFGLSWSLAIEEWFYLTFPLILLFITGLGANAKQAAVCTIGIFIVGSFLFRAYLPAHLPELTHFDEGIRHVVVFRLDSIGFGVLMAYLYLWKRALFENLANYWWVFALIAASCIAYTKSGYLGMSDSAALAPLYFTVSAAAFALLIPKFHSLRPTKLALFNRFIKFTSLISYSLYLGHISGFMIIIWSLQKMKLYDMVYPNPWLTYPLFFIIAYLIAWVTYLAIERPIMQLRDKQTHSAFHPVNLPITPLQD